MGADPSSAPFLDVLLAIELRKRRRDPSRRAQFGTERVAANKSLIPGSLAGVPIGTLEMLHRVQISIFLRYIQKELTK